MVETRVGDLHVYAFEVVQGLRADGVSNLGTTTAQKSEWVPRRARI